MAEECGSCHEEIDWATGTEPNPKTGKFPRQPVNHDSAGDPKGNLAVWRDPRTRALHFRYLTRAEPDLRPGEKRGISHYATCPDAESYRRRAS